MPLRAMASDSTELFDEYRRTGRRSIRNRIVEEHMGLAIHIARGFENRSRRDRDIEQVAMLALVKAVDRFDVTIGVPFTAFAGRTIEGEIKRYFRDSTWAVKVPRGAKELNVAVRRAIDDAPRRRSRRRSHGVGGRHGAQRRHDRAVVRRRVRR
jgi:RNA polymerase sigma-B factor